MFSRGSHEVVLRILRNKEACKESVNKCVPLGLLRIYPGCIFFWATKLVQQKHKKLCDPE